MQHLPNQNRAFAEMMSICRPQRPASHLSRRKLCDTFTVPQLPPQNWSAEVMDTVTLIDRDLAQARQR